MSRWLPSQFWQYHTSYFARFSYIFPGVLIATSLYLFILCNLRIDLLLSGLCFFKDISNFFIFAILYLEIHLYFNQFLLIDLFVDFQSCHNFSCLFAWCRIIDMLNVLLEGLHLGRRLGVDWLILVCCRKQSFGDSDNELLEGSNYHNYY
jgi:hypothetical protein